MLKLSLDAARSPLLKMRAASPIFFDAYHGSLCYGHAINKH
jgi:hypothetical protein